MNRRDTFEKTYAEAHDWPIETLVQHRMGDTYRLPLIAKCWRFWSLALDSVEVELPTPHYEFEGDPAPEMFASDVRKSIEEAGLKVSG